MGWQSDVSSALGLSLETVSGPLHENGVGPLSCDTGIL